MSTNPQPLPSLNEQAEFLYMQQQLHAMTDQQNSLNAAQYRAYWSQTFLPTLTLAYSRPGTPLPVPNPPAKLIKLTDNTYEQWKSNENAVSVQFGPEFCTEPNTVPGPPPAPTGGIGAQLPGSTGWFQSLPGDIVPDHTQVQGTSADGISGTFLKLASLSNADPKVSVPGWYLLIGPPAPAPAAAAKPAASPFAAGVLAGK